jgi:hypothetical protein
MDSELSLTVTSQRMDARYTWPERYKPSELQNRISHLSRQQMFFVTVEG